MRQGYLFRIVLKCVKPTVVSVRQEAVFQLVRIHIQCRILTVGWYIGVHNYCCGEVSNGLIRWNAYEEGGRKGGLL